MKKLLYMILLVAEFAGGFLLLTLVTGAMGWAYFLAVTAVWAALTALVAMKLKKTEDEAARRKGKRNLALAMLIPAVGAVIGLVGFVVAMTSASW